MLTIFECFNLDNNFGSMQTLTVLWYTYLREVLQEINIDYLDLFVLVREFNIHFIKSPPVGQSRDPVDP